MSTTALVKRALVSAFEFFTTLAVLLNVFAAAMAMKRDMWTIAGGYLVIASTLAALLAVHWYIKHRQAPYRWRDESWGLERWREPQPADGDEWRDEDSGDGLWSDERWRDDRDE